MNTTINDFKNNSPKHLTNEYDLANQLAFDIELELLANELLSRHYDKTLIKTAI